MLSDSDRQCLAEAKRILDSPNFLMKTLNRIGMPVERGMEMLPAKVSKTIITVSRKALRGSLQAAVATLDGSKRDKPPSRALHRSAVVLSGGIAGAFGLPALALELPLSTTIMFRAIADIARSLGEDLNDPETLLNCLEVFALGGRSKSDDDAQEAYFVVRAVLADEVSKAAAYLAQHAGAAAATQATAPALVRLIDVVATRFSAAVTEKVAAASVPAIGALGGAAINAIFMDHYQKMAWAHFTVRGLERRYGQEAIALEWDQVKAGKG